MHVEAVFGSAKFRSPVLSHGSVLPPLPNVAGAPPADLCRRRGEKRRCGIRSSCKVMRECTTFRSVRWTVSPLWQLSMWRQREKCWPMLLGEERTETQAGKLYFLRWQSP